MVISALVFPKRRIVVTLSASDTRDVSTLRAAHFVSDSTGVTAETLGSALLANSPGIRFLKRTIPFVAECDEHHSR